MKMSDRLLLCKVAVKVVIAGVNALMGPETALPVGLRLVAALDALDEVSRQAAGVTHD